MRIYLLLIFIIPGVVARAQQTTSGFFDSYAVHYSLPIELQNGNLQSVVFNPPGVSVRAVGQFEEMQGVTITWTTYPHVLAQIVDAAQEEVRVYIVCSDSNVVKNALTGYGVPLYNITYCVKPFNTIWARDYGFNSIYLNDVDSLSFVDWRYNRPRPKDDTVPYGLGLIMGYPVYSTTQGTNYLVNTGGNYMGDGHGTAFASKLILSDNLSGAGYGGNATEQEIDTLMNHFMGINRYIKMNTLPYDGIHHIDMHMKLLDEETLLIGEYPAGVADGPAIEQNIQYIQNNFTSCYGRPYKIIRIPQPPDKNGHFPNAGGEYCTYTNAIILNHIVILPNYYAQYDTIANRIWQEAMPGYTIIPIDCDNGADDIISQSGAIHCITHEIAVNEPVWISHAKLYDTYEQINPYPVIASIKSRSGINYATLFWSVDTTLGYAITSMTAMANDSFIALIPAQPAGTHIYYYIEAESVSGRIVRKPMVAPNGVIHFTVMDNSLVEESFANLPRFYDPYPNPASGNFNIRFSIPVNSMVTLGIFDLSGKRISMLLQEEISGGIHEYRLNLESLDPGIYFLKFNSGKMNISKKIVLLK